MDLERRLELILRPPTEEVITIEDLRSLLEVNEHPVAYDGFEPSGLAHLPFGILRPIKLQDMLEAGCKFKHLIDCVEAFLDLLNDPETDFRVKLMDYGKVKSDVFEFCRYYAKWLGNPLMERLKHEIYEILEEAVDWWGRWDALDIIGR